MSEITSSPRIIDLRSDTVSQPTDRMRKAMAEAIVGDDVYGEDPTIIELETKCAKLFEKEAAIFVPSGTMGNLISTMVHCNHRGQEAIVGNLSHVFLYEQGGAATIAGVLLNPIQNKEDGTFCLEEMVSKFRGNDYHEPKTSLAIVENTHNMCGGKVIPLHWLDAFCSICKENNISTHMDGARVFHAAEYLKVPVARIARDFDSITFCLSKSLCAPVGSILVGTTAFIREARRIRKALGGGMRQAGILAAAGLVAIDDIVPNIGGDHIRLEKIGRAIEEIQSPYVTVDIANLQTNICIIKMTNVKKYPASILANRLVRIDENEVNNGVTDGNGNGIILKVSTRDWSFMRIVLYHHITDELVELAIKKLQYCIKELQ